MPKENEELIFVLMKPNQKVSKSTKNTMGKWCDKHDILWYNIETLKELVDYVSDTREIKERCCGYTILMILSKPCKYLQRTC